MVDFEMMGNAKSVIGARRFDINLDGRSTVK